MNQYILVQLYNEVVRWGKGFQMSPIFSRFSWARTHFLSVAHVLELVAGYCCFLSLLDHCKWSNVINTALSWASIWFGTLKFGTNGMVFSRSGICFHCGLSLVIKVWWLASWPWHAAMTRCGSLTMTTPQLCAKQGRPCWLPSPPPAKSLWCSV